MFSTKLDHRRSHKRPDMYSWCENTRKNHFTMHRDGNGGFRPESSTGVGVLPTIPVPLKPTTQFVDFLEIHIDGRVFRDHQPHVMPNHWTGKAAQREGFSYCYLCEIGDEIDIEETVFTITLKGIYPNVTKMPVEFSNRKSFICVPPKPPRFGIVAHIDATTDRKTWLEAADELIEHSRQQKDKLIVPNDGGGPPISLDVSWFDEKEQMFKVVKLNKEVID